MIPLIFSTMINRQNKMKTLKLIFSIIGFLILSGCRPSLDIGKPHFVKMKFEDLGFSIQDQTAPELLVQGEGIVGNSFFSANKNGNEVLIAIYEFISLDAMTPYLEIIHEPCDNKTYWGCGRSIQANSVVIFFPINISPEDFDIVVDDYWNHGKNVIAE